VRRYTESRPGRGLANNWPEAVYGKAGEKMSEVYEKLRAYLDSLPGGFPAAESGVELRILKHLFTPEEAEIATFLGMKLEPAEAIAQKAGMNEEKASKLVRRMAKKGLIFSIESPDRPPVFMAAQFVAGYGNTT
jgi:electron transport complex protein RnfB